MTLTQTARGVRSVSGLLLALLIWQAWGLRHVRATLASALAVSDVAWRTPPPAFPVVQLDRLLPPAPVSGAAGSAPLAVGPEAPRLTLQGIVFSQTPRAYVLDERTHQTVTVRPGDTLGPLTIKAIRERTVLIEQEGSTYELRL